MDTRALRGYEFRYLTKNYLDSPMDYIQNFYSSETLIHYWLRDIHLLINAAACPELNHPEVKGNNGYHCKQLIEQIEAAYVLFKKQQFDPQSCCFDFFPSSEDFSRYSSDGTITVYGEINPFDTIAKFFSYQSLEDWYDTLDDIWMGLTSPENERNDRFGDRIVVIREFLMRLAQAMYDLFERPGLFVAAESSCMEKKADDARKSDDALSDRREETDDSDDLQNELHQLRELFDFAFFEEWKEFLIRWENSIFSTYESWEEVCEVYNPVTRLAFVKVLSDFFEHLEEVSSISYDKLTDDQMNDRASVASPIIKYKGDMLCIENLSIREIAYPQYNLIDIYWTYRKTEWMSKIADWSQASFSKNLLTIIDGEEVVNKDFILVRKMVELSFLIANRGEIEFVHPKDTP